MTTDTSQAFAHPEARAIATAGSDPLDRISLRDHVVEVEIGAFQEERGRRQRISFNIVVEVLQHEGAYTDDVDKILSYDTITQAIQAEIGAERINLLETLAARIADRILTEPQAMRVFVRIEKLDRGPGALGVEIVRSAAPHVAQPHDDIPHPTVVFFSNEAIASPNLTGWLDQLEKLHEPVVFCVGQAKAVAPQAGAAPVQRRIDLLAIEQNAWVLAGRDPRCVVMSTRTELDWAARNGKMAVWAPSKIVLDAVDQPPAGSEDAVALTQW
ncbi:MAG: dihydroneopterin aldolase, partial [Paracoccaceae bacterium]|nr:dihydroneopterin aldolase [Paracoccaceae bacterium]